MFTGLQSATVKSRGKKCGIGLLGFFFHVTDYTGTYKIECSGPFLRPRVWGLSLR